MTKYELSEIWIKASITGTIWAASEIVLGSFLHNLRVPFSGNVLTGIGIIILISLSYSWKDKGLFWRAGLICAIMKTISPSAVIFGPIIAILCESLLIELSVRLLGRNFIGFALGAMLAMSWNLFQRIVNLLIFYGLNILQLYEDLIKLAQKQLQIQTDILWLPLIVLLVVYCILGLISAIVGIRIGKKLLNQPKNSQADALVNESVKYTNKSGKDFHYSLIWLFADFVLLVSALFLLNFVDAIWWSLFILAVSVVWSMRYKRALRQLTKPGFWLFFAAITMITAFVFSRVQGQEWQDGLLIGLQMNFRAAVVVLGFSVLGTELYNPVIRSFFLKTSFKQLPSALELSFASLPLMIARIPHFTLVMKNPVSVIYQIVAYGEERLEEIRNAKMWFPSVWLVSGALGGGKTTFVKIVAEILITHNCRIGGFLSVRRSEADVTIGYDLQEINSNERVKFLQLVTAEATEKIGRFEICHEGVKKGNDILDHTITSSYDLVVIDEVGRLELRGDGWARSIQNLMGVSKNMLLITVRDGLELEVIHKLKLKNYQIVHVGVTDAAHLAQRILKRLEESKFIANKDRDA